MTYNVFGGTLIPTLLLLNESHNIAASHSWQTEQESSHLNCMHCSTTVLLRARAYSLGHLIFF